MKILFAEDDEFIAKLIRFKLEKAGHQLTYAPDGKAAEEAMMADLFDVYVFDVMMPFQDGWSLLKKLKQMPGGDLKKVIMLTAKAHPNDFEQAMQLKADYYLRKPFDPDVLLKTVEEAGLSAPENK